MDKLNVLIAGSTGYIGTQLVKLLCKHKNIKIKYLCGNTSVGKNISSYDKDLKKYKLPKIKILYNFLNFKKNSFFNRILLVNKRLIHSILNSIMCTFEGLKMGDNSCEIL